MANALVYLGDHAAIAQLLGKPVFVEEFGASRDSGTYDPEAGTSYRDRYYRQLFGAAAYLAEAGRPVMGTNVWSWAGEARPPRPGEPGRMGDPLIGDPPHEDQGWYSIYDADTGTQAVLVAHAPRMAALLGGGQE